MSNVERIKKLEAEADKLSAEYESNRWETARLISEELAAGTSQRELASQIGKSAMHVNRMNKCWSIAKRNPRVTAERSFNEVYHSAEVRGEPKPKPEPEDNRRYDPEDYRKEDEPGDDEERKQERREKKENEQGRRGWIHLQFQIADTAIGNALEREDMWDEINQADLTRMTRITDRINMIRKGTIRDVSVGTEDARMGKQRRA